MNMKSFLLNKKTIRLLISNRNAVFFGCFLSVGFFTWILIMCSWWLTVIVTVIGSSYIAGLFAWQVGREILRCSVNARNTLQPTGKCVLVTGCGSGFGHQVAKSLHKKGYYVFAGCRLPEEGGAKELSALGIDVIGLDVTNQESVDRAYQHVKQSMGKDKGLWAVVNNAGVMFFSPLEWQSIDTLHETLDVNLVGTWRTTKAFLPLLRTTRGRVVNIASASTFCQCAGQTSYSASKWGVLALSEGLGMELRRFGIRIVTVIPGVYKTPMTEPSRIRDHLSQVYQSCPQEMQSLYGVNADRDYSEFFTNLHNNTYRTDIREVVDAILDGVTSFEPKGRYLAMGRLERVMAVLCMCMPIEWTRVIVELTGRDYGLFGTVCNWVRHRC